VQRRSAEKKCREIQPFSPSSLPLARFEAIPAQGFCGKAPFPLLLFSEMSEAKSRSPRADRSAILRDRERLVALREADLNRREEELERREASHREQVALLAATHEYLRGVIKELQPQKDLAQDAAPPDPLSQPVLDIVVSSSQETDFSEHSAQRPNW